MNEELINLFQPAFPGANLNVRSEAKDFICKNILDCSVDKQNEAIWSPAIGDENTKVMLIAEAPSVSGGSGIHIGGQFSDYGNTNLLNFVKKYYNTIPYFTDVMKCGVSKQSRENKSKVFKKREENCFEIFLIKEIEIIKPEVILCLGNTAYKVIHKELNKIDSRIDKATNVFKLVHYSKQANLQLTLKDKEDIIWPLQIKKITKDNLKNLSMFQDNSEIENNSK